MSDFTGNQKRLLSQLDRTVVVSTTYSSSERVGVTVLVTAASLSLLCAVVLLGILAVSMWKRRSAPSEHFFVRTHAAAYFASLILADAMQGVGSIMSTKWVVDSGVSLGPFCSAQGALKNAGNVAVSLWSLMLAIHAFCVLFLRMKPKDWVLYVTLIGVWFLVGFVVFIGPAAIQKVDQGPYFGISGYWCWISDPYSVSRIVLEYAWMFTSAGLSFILYTLTYLRLRGYITIEDGKMKFTRVKSSDAWQYQVTRSSSDVQMTGVMMGMIWFPILFTVLILPIAICRFLSWSGKSVPFEATIFADSVFSLMGVFDLILFATTRSLFPRDIVVWFSPRPTVSDEVRKHGVQPYNVHDFTSAHGFNDMYQTQAEKGIVTPPPRTSASLGRSTIPNRPPRPVSLNAVPLSPALHTPENIGSLARNPARMTSRTFASQYSQDEETDVAAWDMVDLDRADSDTPISPQQNRFRLPNIRDTTFTVSAYHYGNEAEEVPPMPSGAGIDISAGRYYSNEEDTQHLTRSGHSRSLSGDSFDGPSSPEILATARRF